MRAFLAFMAQGFRQQSAYRVEGWLGLFSSMVWFVLYAGIWSALLRNDPAALQRQMQYVIASRFLAELHFLPTWEVADKFRQGDIGLELIKPVALPVRQVAEFFGRACFRLLRAAPIFILIWWVAGGPAPSVGTVGLFLVSALLGWIITCTLQLSLTLIALWTVQFNEAEQLYITVVQLFSGTFLPLHYLPGWIGAFAIYLPFAGIYYIPSAILSGTLVGAALTKGLLLQVLWAAIGTGLLSAIWAAGSRKLTVQGG